MIPSRGKCPRRRSSHVQLTEKEINDFIAHNDEDEGSGSDWDDVGETDLSTILSNSAIAPEDVITNRSLETVCSDYKDVGRGIKDVGVSELFGTVPSNLSLNEKETVSNLQQLFGTDNLSDDDVNNDSEDDFNELTGIEDDEKDRGLSENGASIQKCLSVKQHSEKDKLIERHVNEAIQFEEKQKKTSLPATSSKNNNDRNSVSTALAACALRRKQAISALNAASFTPFGNHSPAVLTKSAAITPISRNTNSNDGQTTSADKDCWFAVPTRLRVYRTRISSELWSSRTSDREVLTLSQYIQRRRSHQLMMSKSEKPFSTEAVVVGVIGSKLPPRRSRKDRIYSVWCLSDLEHVGPGASSGCVKLFLFGNCHEKLWKEPEGSVVAVLNPRSLASDAAFTDEKDIGITLDSPCIATTKSGQRCFHVVNKTVCRYCDFHVKKAYIEASSSRPGFVSASLPGFSGKSQSRYTGDRPPLLLSLVPVVPSARVKLSVAKLAAAGYQVDASSGLGGKGKTAATSKTSSISSLSVSSSQNTNPSECDNPISRHKFSGITDHSSGKTAESSKSCSPNHEGTLSGLNEAESKLISALRRPSAGSLNLLRHLEQESEIVPITTPSANTTDNISVKSQKKINCAKFSSGTQKSSSQVNSSAVTFAEFFSSVNERRRHSIPSLSDTMMPTLNNKSETFIDLGPMPSIDAARLRASALVNSHGGITEMINSEAHKRKVDILKKASFTNSSPLSEILDNNPSKRPKLTTSVSNLANDKPRSSHQTAEQSLKQMRANKLAKLAQQISQGSAHTSLVTELENQTENIRLTNLERRDEFEEKLVNQEKEACTYVICETCNYRAFKAAPACRTSSHQLKYLKGFKRYFRCRQCSKRTVSLDRYPTKSCHYCGESLFEKAGVMKERKGVPLPHEQLLPRGIEEKFLG
ncbi:unnamed protein product [Heterobilharzia americana]|nr:unnamed protein product [Heterobilharzia americana]